MKQWCYYKVLVRRFGGFWWPDDTEGHREEYESRDEAMARADELYAEKVEPEVQIQETVIKIISWLGRKETQG